MTRFLQTLLAENAKAIVPQFLPGKTAPLTCAELKGFNDDPGLIARMARLLNLADTKALALMLVYCFLAGFSERLVPDVDRLSDNLRSKKGA